MNFFFFGTLMDPDILAAVLDRAVLKLPQEPAVLAGYRRVHFGGQVYPALVTDAAAETTGLLVKGLSRAHATALDRFEGPAYRRETLTVTAKATARQRAFVYLLRDERQAGDQAWDFEAWRRDGKRAFLGSFGGWTRVK